MIDEVFIASLVEHGFLRCGPSRGYVEFERKFEEYAAVLRTDGLRQDFSELTSRLPESSGISKVDYQPEDDPRGHKLSIQFEYDFADTVLWDEESVRPEIVELAAAAVRLVRYDLMRSPIRLMAGDPSAQRSTVRGIIYYPGSFPGVGWHTDGCVAQFISIPSGDRSLYVNRQLPPDRSVQPEVTPGAVNVPGGPTPETLMLLGEQASYLAELARATPHAVSALNAPRTVVTHFVWRRDNPTGVAA